MYKMITIFKTRPEREVILLTQHTTIEALFRRIKSMDSKLATLLGSKINYCIVDYTFRLGKAAGDTCIWR